MTKLLGGQIMFGDFLYVHLSTPSTTVIEVEKTSQMFGLTITDNGNGQVSLRYPNLHRSSRGKLASVSLVEKNVED